MLVRRKWGTRMASAVVAVMVLCGTALAAEPAEGVQFLKYDRPAGVSQMPENFRTAASNFKKSKTGVYPTREGLDSMRISGSSFFAKNELPNVVKKIPAKAKDIIILDLRDESHGYINDNGVSWYSRYKTYNKGLTAKEVMQREKTLLQGVKKAGVADIATQAKDKSVASLTRVKVDSVQSEKMFVESLGLKYYRIPMMDYSAPSIANIDQFITFYKALPKDAWIHDHCEAGVGRTTIVLSLIDMIHNANKVSYDDIMTRQVLLGGEDVRYSHSKDAYKAFNYPIRGLFTKHFYDYAKAHPNLDISWSEWCKQQGYANYNSHLGL